MLRKRGVLETKDEPAEFVPVRVRDTRSEVRVHLPNGVVVACSEPSVPTTAWFELPRTAHDILILVDDMRQ